MSHITGVIKAFQTRIQTAMASGGQLTVVKQCQIGSLDETRTDIDLPIVCICPQESTLTYKHQPHGAAEAMLMRVKLVDVPVEGDDALTTGIYATLEKLLNTIETNPSTGAVDLHLTDTIQSLPGYTYRVIESDRLVTIEIDYEVECNTFQLGSR